jgi:hypothetical protein
MSKIKVTISCDDTNPLPGWGAKGDKQWEYMDSLNQEFGIKMNHFIPANYHRQAPLSKHKEWVEWMLSKGYIELSAHGLYHETSDKPRLGECEFFELQDKDEAEARVQNMFSEWSAVGHRPKGWRNPGWLSSPASTGVLKNYFYWAALHYEHNMGQYWGQCRMIYGADGINEPEIKMHMGGDVVMFQSHIAGEWNKNIWNEDNYNNLRNWLQFLTTEHEVEFLTLSDLVSDRTGADQELITTGSWEV